MSTAPTQHHLEANGGRLYYEVRGAGPLLLVVGQPMTSGAVRGRWPTTWRPITQWSPTTLTGWARARSTTGPLPITPEIEADDLAAIVDELGLGPPP